MGKRALNILIIDDDVSEKNPVIDVLEGAGHRLITTDNGDKGINAFREKKPDIILCDINMQSKKGHDVLSIVHEERPNTPFIVISAASCIHEAVDALRKGAWDYIIKPMTDVDSLMHAINKALERCKLLQENERYRERLEVANEELSKNLATLEEDQEAGRCVQFQLLPEKKQKIGHFHLDHYIMPSLYLSGDFVDYFSIDDHTLGFYIADVSGHGAPSAFITVLLKSLVNHFVLRYGAHTNDMIINPGKLLHWLSQDILRAKLGKYLTMVYGVIDEDKNTLTYSVGGHFPNPIIKTGEGAEYLKGSGFPIGVFDKAVYENHSIELPNSFELFMFSDGVLELLPQENLEEKERYLLSMVGTPNSSIDYILKEIDIEKYQAIPDDVTILTLKRG